MSDLIRKKQTGCALRSNHLEWREGPCDIERVTAFGMAGFVSPLGASFYRLYAAQDAREWPRTISLLTERVRGAEMPYSWRELIAKQVLREALDPSCQTCQGRGAINVGRAENRSGVAYICPACDGAAARRYSDEERAANLEIGGSLKVYRRKFEQPIARCHEVLRREIVRVSMALKGKTEE